MVARGVGREVAASVAAHRDILYRIQHPCGMIIPCFSPVVNTFFCGFGGSRNFRDIVTKTTGYSGVVWLKGRPGGTVERGEPRARRVACPAGCRLTLPPLSPAGGRAFFVACQPCLWFSLLPPSPRPALAERSSPPGKGEIFSFLMQGASPLASLRLSQRRHLHDQRFLFVYGGQCRQPRRGGTGGDGTIRRKRRRRLRWSSPPGQGEPMPAGFSPLPLGTANARRASEARAIPRAGNNTGSKTAATP